MSRKITIFYAYAQKDEALRKKLEIHLAPLQQAGLITGWYDRNISTGIKWEREIANHLNTAQIILLLVSPDFLASQYCYSVEMKRALERGERGEARVIPIILRSVDWKKTPLGTLQALPTGARPVTSRGWYNQDEAFTDVAQGIGKVVEELCSQSGDVLLSRDEVEEWKPESSGVSMNPGAENIIQDTIKADILLVTVTSIEAQAVLNMFVEETGQVFQRHFIGDKTYFDLGVLKGARIVMVQSEMGASGPGGALLVVDEGIRMLSPSAVIMVGIAFGLNETLSIGDILVSQQLLGYELQKVATGSEGKVEIIPRGDRARASTKLLDRFLGGLLDWHGPKVEYGLILSGDKLIDHQDFRNQLRKLAPEAIGGEMEGIGLYSAAQRRKVDWIIIKAICDWADGNKGQDKNTRQQLAAENAIRFTLHVLNQGGFVEDVSNISTSSTRTNKRISLLPPERGKLLYPPYDVHASYVVAVAWEPSGARIASAGGDGTVRVWEAETGKTLLTYRGHTHWLNKINRQITVYTVSWHPKGKRIVSAGVGASVHVWDAATGQDLALYEGHSGLAPYVWAVAWSPDGERIASACSSAGLDKTVHLWDAATGQAITRYRVPSGLMPNFSVLSLAWSPDGTRIAAACSQDAIRVWDTATGHLVSTHRSGSECVSHIAWSPDSRYLALAQSDHKARVWDTSTEKNVTIYYDHKDGVRYVAWSPDGKLLATASNDRTVHIWEPLTGKRIFVYEGHADWATAVAWSPDGNRIASASNDKTVRVWQAVGG